MNRAILSCRYLLIGILVLQSLLLNGCGYRLIGASSEAPQYFTVAIPVFNNLTYRAAGEGDFTEAVVLALLQHGVRIVDTATADYIVAGEIASLTMVDVAFSAADKAVLNTAEVAIDITIRRRQQDTVLLKEQVRRRVAYPAQANVALQPSVGGAASKELAEQVAQLVLLRLQTLPRGSTNP